jgi:hypothetical protein
MIVMSLHDVSDVVSSNDWLHASFIDSKHLIINV